MIQLPTRARRMAGFFDGERAFTGPATVQVDLTDACNQNCIVCWLHAPELVNRNRDRLERAASLPFELYVQLLDDLRAMGTEEIYFAGGGEPLAHPRAWDALQEAIHRGFTASLHTNFSLVGKEGVSRLIDLGIHHLTVSLWAGSRETYAATHPGTRPEVFDEVTSWLGELNAKKVDRPETKLYHVLTAENAGELGAMLTLAEQLGCDAVELAIGEVIPGETESHGLGAEDAVRLLAELEAPMERAPWRRPRLLGADSLVTRLSAIARGRDSDDEIVHQQPCFAGWNYARVLADGRVIPCLKAHRIPSGNLHDQSFPAIWDGALQRRFRNATRALRKEGSFFAGIGNDPQAACGCERGCDNHEDNRRAGEQLGSLTRLERAALKALSALPAGLERPGGGLPPGDQGP